MKKALIALALVAVLVAVVFAAVLFFASSSVSDPSSARCGAPLVVFGEPSRLADHREVEVQFTCVGDRQVGTLYLPKRAGRFPAVVYVHGSGETSRWSWDVPWVQMTVRAGIAFFSYDKRGVGESEGTCCPGDTGHFNLLAADADGGSLGRRALGRPHRLHGPRQWADGDDARRAAVESTGRRGG